MKAVIFDVDGTLVNSVDIHARAWQEAFQHFGHDLHFDRIRSQIGKGGDQLIPFLLSASDAELQGKKIEQFRGDLFKAKYLSQITPFPAVRPLFERILNEGWKIGLASSAKADELQTYKKLVNVSDLLDTETSSDDAEKSKPHPDIFLAAWEKLGSVEKSSCVVVGDSPYDAEAALKASMQAVGVLAGGFPEEDLWKAGFQAIFRDAADLLSQFDRFKAVISDQL